MNRIERAREFRRLIDANMRATRQLIRVDDLTPAELEGMIGLYDEYNPNAYPYVAGELFSFRGKMYKAITTHTSQEDWVPSDLPAVYDPITPPGTIAPWEQRYGHNPYREGDKIIWNDLVYVNILSTTYNPTDFPQGWALEDEVNDPEIPVENPMWIQPTGSEDAYQIDDTVTYNGQVWKNIVANNIWKPGEYGWELVIVEDPEEPVDPEEQDPEPTGPAEWAQPTGGHDAYQLGDKVTFQNAIWTSTAANNTWKPGEYGWTQE